MLHICTILGYSIFKIAVNIGKPKGIKLNIDLDNHELVLYYSNEIGISDSPHRIRKI